MTKKISYNTKSKEELILDLTKMKGSIRDVKIEKVKTGNAKNYRATKKNIARVMTALNMVNRLPKS